jgi:hypothetical protein
LAFFFSSFILYTVGRIPWTGDQLDASPLPTQVTTHTQSKYTDIKTSIGIWANDVCVWRGEDSLCLKPVVF